MGDTAISWTNKTWNVIRGCRRVSEGCRNCYAERQARRFAGKGGPYEGLVETRLRVIGGDVQRLEPRWTGKIKFIDEHLVDPITWAKPAMVFVNSMSDLFFEDLRPEDIAAIFGIMAACPRHTFQVLTKRSGHMQAWFRWVEKAARECNGGVGMPIAAFCFALAQNRDHYFTLYGKRTPISRGEVVKAAFEATWPLPNVWLGVSTENQGAADARISDLLATPAAVRWISGEPLLGEIDLEHVQHNGEFEVNALAGTHGVLRPHRGTCAKLDWVVAGAESGPGRRQCDYRWLRSLRDQCAKYGTPFFLKQAECELEDGKDAGLVMNGVRSANFVVRGGIGSKKKGGGIFELPYLDGKQHKEFPCRSS